MTDTGDTVHDPGTGSPDADAGAEAYCSACNQSFAPELLRCPNDGTQLVKFKAQRDEMLGRVLDGRFEVRQPLGKGGMGTVYRALQVSVDREVAVKVVHPKLANDRQAAKRFLREARLASRLNQPNIVNVIDFGQTEDGVLYLVMELLRGRTLAAELDGQRRFSVRRTATIALQLCDALEAAHAQGIVHRDLKPGNVVILDDPPGRDLIKVLDFGLAKSLAADTTSQVTNTNAILGTPVYMSPEQVQGKPSDQRGDLYSFGCILYELLAGRPPFRDESVNVILAMHLGDPPEPLPMMVPAPLRALVERLLAKDPDARIQTAGEARSAIQAVIEAGGVGTMAEAHDTVPEVMLGHAATQDVSSASARAFRRAATPVPAAATANVDAPAPRRRTVGVVLGGLVLVAGAATVSFVAMRGDRNPSAGAGGGTPAVVLDAAAASLGATPPPDAGPPPDAAPAVDAPAAAPPIDARKRDGRSPRTRDAGRAAPRVIDAPPAPRKIDARDPDIDFYRPTPKPR